MFDPISTRENEHFVFELAVKVVLDKKQGEILGMY